MTILAGTVVEQYQGDVGKRREELITPALVLDIDAAQRNIDGSSLRVGDSVALVPGYSPTTVNWYDVYHVVRDDVVVDIWPILPRGPGHHGLAAG